MQLQISEKETYVTHTQLLKFLQERHSIILNELSYSYLIGKKESVKYFGLNIQKMCFIIQKENALEFSKKIEMKYDENILNFVYKFAGKEEDRKCLEEWYEGIFY